MLRHFGIGLLWAVLGYIGGAILCYFLIATLSSNTHDRGLEAVMTAMFAAGPALAIVAFIAGAIRSVRSSRLKTAQPE